MIDARGFSCPTPVLMVKKEIDAKKPQNFSVLVDNACAVENITRFAQSQGYSLSVNKEGEDFRLELKK